MRVLTYLCSISYYTLYIIQKIREIAKIIELITVEVVIVDNLDLCAPVKYTHVKSSASSVILFLHSPIFPILNVGLHLLQEIYNQRFYACYARNNN